MPLHCAPGPRHGPYGVARNQLPQRNGRESLHLTCVCVCVYIWACPNPHATILYLPNRFAPIAAVSRCYSAKEIIPTVAAAVGIAGTRTNPKRKRVNHVAALL